MRLINTSTLELEEHFFENVRRKYAILSHTWGDGEVTFEDMKSPHPGMEAKQGWQKILHTCTEARNHGLQYAWIDSCCIDKSSSSELSESINSMYSWYKEANVCYVYMSDVARPQSGSEVSALMAYEVQPPARISGQTRLEFMRSRWFTRGWTLQEMIAPGHLRFYSKEWTLLSQTLAESDRSEDLYILLREITGVPAALLSGHESITSYSAAQIMSWAANRSTTRVEDQAYSLLGLFDINMPLLYGEGPKAFRRLQEEIVKTKYDHSIFAWEFCGVHDPGKKEPFYDAGDRQLFAPSPTFFAGRGNIVRWKATAHVPSYRLTNQGLEIALFFPNQTQGGAPSIEGDLTRAILECRYADDFSNAICLRLSEPTSAQRQYAVARFGTRARCGLASLSEGDMVGPIRTILVSETGPEAANLLEQTRPRRLWLDTSLLPGPLQLTLLEPASLWNRNTFVFTPAEYDTPKSFLREKYWTSSSAMIGFRLNAEQYLVRVDYGAFFSTMSVATVRPEMEASSKDFVGLANPYMPSPRRLDLGDSGCYCQLSETEQLGQRILVLRVGLPDELSHVRPAP